MNGKFNRLLSLLLVLALCAGLLPVSALATTVSKKADGTITVTDDKGNVETVDESWDETFPYGTFALANPEITVEEGGSTSVILYRLGGTIGRATAFLTYAPAVSMLDEGVTTYAFAAGWDDLSLRVQDPSPMAWYQPLGSADANLKPSGTKPDVDATRTTNDVLDSSGEVLTYGDICYYLPGVKADSYRWQILQRGSSRWEDISGATENSMLVGNDIAKQYDCDYRCVYAIGEETYCTDSVKGVKYVPEAAPKEPPADLVIPNEPTYTTIPDKSAGDSFETYEAVRFPVTFAEGEFEKTIYFDTVEDTKNESDEFGTLTIVDCEGGTLYNSANKATFQIVDNEQKRPTVLSLSANEDEFDRAEGEAVFTVRRTGDLTYPVSVNYTTGSTTDTAIAGTHYARTEGMLLFQGDINELEIKVPLISEPEPSEARYTLTVNLGELKGGRGIGADSLASLDNTEIQTTLYDTGKQVRESVNLATLLAGGVGKDVSGSVGEAEPVTKSAETLTGEAVIPEEAEIVEAVINFGGAEAPESGDEPVFRPFTYTYPDSDNPVTFSRNTGYSNSYWCDWEVLADRKTDYLPSDRSSNARLNTTDVWSTWFDNPKKDSSGDRSFKRESDGGFVLSHNSSAHATLDIPEGSILFDKFRAEFWYGTLGYGRHEKNPKVWLKPRDYAKVPAFGAEHTSKLEAKFDGDNISMKNSTDKFELDWSAKKRDTAKSSALNIRMAMDLKAWNSQTTNVNNDTANGNGKFRLMQAALRHRAFTKNLGLTIYTANDADMLLSSSPYARLDVSDTVNGVIAKNLYTSIKPSITLVPNMSGVNEFGQLYVGSTLSIALNSTGSYEAPTVSESDPDYSVFLTKKSDSKTVVARGEYKSTEGKVKIYHLRLFWPGMHTTENPTSFLTDEYVLNVVMNRKQNVIVDLSPSVPRKSDGITIDTTKIGAALNDFKQGESNINFKYAYTTDSSYKYFASHTDYKNKSQLSLSNNSAKLEIGPMDNLYEINFGLPAEDRVVFNGRIYNGDQTIYLQPKDLSQENLIFYYYDKEYLHVPSVMKANLDRTSLYLDANGNGKIDGYFNDTIGNFVLTDATGGTTGKMDELIATYSSSEIYDVDERYTEPVEREGIEGRCGYFLLAWYNMNPRKLEALPDEEDLTATIRPAFTTSATDANAKAALTPEQRLFRNLEAGKTKLSKGVGDTDSAAGKPMYGEAASEMNYVVIPLGGDYNPPKLNADATAYEWEPEYRGNLHEDMLFTHETAKSVAPITLANTVVGRNFPVTVAESATKGTDGSYEYTYDEKNLEQLNGYLGSFLGATTFNFSVVAPTIEDPYKFSVESVTRGNMSCHPNSEYLKSMSGNNSDADMDMGESGNSYSEFNMDFESKQGATNLNISDYITIIVSGYEVGFAVGLPLGGYHSNGDAGTGGPGGSGGGTMYGPGTANTSRAEELGAVRDWINGPSGGFRPTDDSLTAAKDNNKHSAKGMGIELSFQLAMIWKYNPLDNGYYFSRMSVAIAGNLVFTLMYRLTVCPIVYAYVKIGAGLELTTGLGVARTAKTAKDPSIRMDTTLNREFMDYSDPLKLDMGDSVVFKTKYKAFDATFKGSLLVEVSETYDYLAGSDGGFTPIDEVKGKKLRTGVLASGGGNPMTVVLAEKDGNLLGDKEYYVRLTATKETDLTKVIDVIDANTLVYWTGMTLQPSAYLEVGVGLGVELLKVELFVSTSITFKLIFGGFNVDEEKYEGFEFTDFEFTIGMTLRVVAIVFNFDFDLIRYVITYGPRSEMDSTKVWKHGFKALGGAIEEDEELKSGGRTRGIDSPQLMQQQQQPAEGESVLVTITLPESTAATQRIYAPEEEPDPTAIMPMAFNPNDTDVPFQLSGYGSAADAFKLADGLNSKRSYQVITVGNDNYLLYTISRPDEGTNILDDPMLVMSKIKVTGNGDSYGLVHPINPENATGYIRVDKDLTGDLDFSVWAEGAKIHVSWVSYATVNTDNPNSAQDPLAYQTEKSKNTVVKHAVFDTAAPAEFSAPDIVTGETTTTTGEGEGTTTDPVPNVGANVYLPAGGGEAVFYAKTNHYSVTPAPAAEEGGEEGPSEQELAEARYSDYLDIAHATPTVESGDDQSAQNSAYGGIREFLLLNRKSDYGLFGKSAALHLWTGGETPISASYNLADGQLLGNLEFTKKDGGWMLAYTTYELAYFDHSTGKTVADDTPLSDVTAGKLDEVKIQRLYLQDVSLSGATVTWGEPQLVRNLVDFDIDSSQDGRWSESARVGEKYEDPTFANLRFLTAKLGDSLKGGEPVDKPVTMSLMSTQPETFLLFDMMGSTYVIPEEDLGKIIAGDSNALIYPFFVPAKTENDEGEPINAATGRIGVSIGADGDGNLAAVYTEAMEHTGSNGLFVSWYDPSLSVWGQGRLLAMQHMQVYEDGPEYGLDGDQMEQAYLGRKTGNTEYDNHIADPLTPQSDKGSMKQFKFSDLQIALGQGAAPADSGEGNASNATLLVLTQGALTELKEYEVKDTDPLQTLIRPDAAAVTGFYAVSFGAGEQRIDKASLTFADYGFSTDDILQSYVTFTNTGDASFRGSTRNPITAKLTASKPSGGGSVDIAEWKIPENIQPGQSVSLMNEGDAAYTLKSALPEGTEFILTVSEDDGYVADPATDTTDSLLKVEKRPELGFENLNIVSKSVDDNGNTVLEVTGEVSNRGSAEATGVFVQFSYQTGETEVTEENKLPTPIYTPLNIKDNTLTVGKQETLTKMRLMSNGTEDQQKGILRMKAANEGNTAGVIEQNRYRKITGTITVPSSCYYQGDENKSLNLRLEIFSAADNISTDSKGLCSSDHAGEYKSVNNAQTVLVSPKTWFIDAPNRVVMALGNTMRLPLKIKSTTGRTPIITASEMSDKTEGWSPILDILYYDEQSKNLVVVPSEEGEGYIRIADTDTASFRDIYYTVSEVGAGINIFDDNELFTFGPGNKPEDYWEFVDSAVFGYGNTPPYRNDVSIGKKGATVTFPTSAKSIDLYFYGDVEVKSDLPGYTDTVLLRTDMDSAPPKTISFGDNKDKTVHNVTITVKSDRTQLDRLVETFSDNIPPTPADSVAAPQIYWSRSFPDTASIETGKNPVALTCYILDDGALNSVTFNSETPAGLKKNAEGFWQFDLTVRENGSITVTAIDTAGQATTRTIRVDWFAGKISVGADATAPDLSNVSFVDGEGKALPANVKGGDYFLTYTTDAANTAAGALYDRDTASFQGLSAPESIGSTSKEGIKVNRNGIYRVRVTDENSNWSSNIVLLDKLDDTVPQPALYRNRNSYILRYDVRKTGSAPLTEVTLNGFDLLGTDAGKVKTVSGDRPFAYGGKYTLFAKDSLNNEEEASLTIDNIPVIAGTDAYTLTDPWNQTEDNGSIEITMSKLSGGYYVPAKVASGNGAQSSYEGSYEYHLATGNQLDRTGTVFKALLDDDSKWTAMSGSSVTIDELEPGDYTLYIRDAQDKGNIVTVLAHSFTLVSRKVDFALQVTQPVLQPNSNDGIFTLTAQGGNSGTVTDAKTYEFSLESIIGYDTETDPSKIPLKDVSAVSGWQDSDNNTPTVKTFSGNAPGWYQLSVRDKGLTYSGASDTDWDNAATRAVYMPQRSGDATLKELAVAGYPFRETFSADRTEYTVNVPSTANRVAIDAVANNDNAKITGDGVKDIKFAKNTITILVTAEDEITTKEYTIIINRLMLDDGTLNPPISSVGNDWDTITRTIEKAEDGDIITVDMNGSTILPADVQDALEGRDVTLELKVDDTLTWSIKGTDVPDTEHSDVDVGATLGGNAIPEDVVDDLAGDAESIQLSLNHNGELGFTGTLNAHLGSSYANQWANLYYCPKDGEPKFLSAHLIDANGRVLLSLDRGGDYLIVIDDHAHGEWLNPFTDVKESDWFYDAVKYVNERGLLRGTSETTFSPDMSMSRAMIVTVLHRLYGSPKPAAAAPFPDVPAGEWYSEAVAWAAENGVVNGYDDGRFAPADSVTREQLAAILFRCGNYRNLDMSAPETDITGYADYGTISAYALEAMRWACGTGILTGKPDNRLDPGGTASRAEAAAMLMRYCENIKPRLRGNRP